MYTRENYKKVTEELNASRIAREAEAEERNRELCAISRELREIDAELRTTGMQLFKIACAGGDVAPLRERNQFLCRERERIIIELGYPVDYTEPKYSCMKCGDTGFVDGTSRCDCFREKIIKENIKSSGIGKLIESQSFDNFRLDVYQGDEAVYKRMKTIYERAKRYAENFASAPTTLLLLGKTGTGKTHISTSIAGALIAKGVEVLYDSSQNIVSAFENDRFKSGYGKYEPEGDKYLDCELLIIDDLGTEFINQFTISCLYNLINTRQNKGLKTIISSNFDSTDLRVKYEGRIHSRILGSDSTVWQFAGVDFRLAGLKKKIQG